MKTKSTITIKQIASKIGRNKIQIQTLKGLRLGKMNSLSILEDTPAIRGMVNKIPHLVKILEQI